MLHGFAQSGPMFEQKTAFIRDEICRALSVVSIREARDPRFTFVEAPFALTRDALPSFDLDGAKQQCGYETPDAYTWWHLTGKTPPFLYNGLDVSLSSIANTILKQGPFDGIIGFSQGAAFAAMVASLLEHGRKDSFDKAETLGGMPYPSAFVTGTSVIQPPLKFVVAMSGFAGTGVPPYQAFYHPKIATPSLHLLGASDNFIKSAMSQKLLDAFVEPKVLVHQGGHVVPQAEHLEESVELSHFLKFVL
ncbi:hypothetical protein QM012_002121 [Aureobasidium pullulans]|uniref:Serine hydrolase domain-containing protein n=1 Tax=Aureobasidium pullulans TaxID=5580 RepID=A0ABR0TC93_AURPU